MAQNRPIFRRASWAQYDKPYKTYVKKDIAVDRSPGRDFGLDNFSYDEDYLVKWHVPDHIFGDLPAELRECLRDWQAAGAAVHTALERVEKLYNESLYRGYPDRRHSHLSRRSSGPASAVDSPIVSSPMSPMPMLPGAIAPYDRATSSPFVSIPPHQTIGLESPPFTPLDSNAPGTPFNFVDSTKTYNPQSVFDLAKINTELSNSPLSRRDSTISVGSAAFDPNAWETYLNTFNSALEDARSVALVRFKGYGYTIDRLRVEYTHDPEYTSAIANFGVWWSGTKTKISDVEQRVRELEAPDLEYVRLERMAKGMVV